MNIVIVGTGFGGLAASMALVHKLKRQEIQVTVISDRDYFLFRPSLVWVPFGEREIENLTVPLTTLFHQHGINFIKDRVLNISAEQKVISLLSGQKITFDYLILASGASLDFSKLRGRKRQFHSFYTEPTAVHTRRIVHNIQPGNSVVIGSSKQNPNPLPAYEFAFELHHFLQKKSIKANLSFFTAEKSIASFYPKKLQEKVQNLFTEKNISVYENCDIQKVQKHHIILSQDVTIPFEQLFVLPPYKGASFIYSSDIPHDNGLVTVRNTMQSIKWEYVYAVGDGATILSSTWMKNGHSAEQQGVISAKNVLSQLNNKQAQATFQPSLMSLMETGSDGGILAIHYKLFHLELSGLIPHQMKKMFESYYLKKVELFGEA